MDESESRKSLFEDYLLLTNRVNIHSCSDYCLCKSNNNNSSGKSERKCRMEFGTNLTPGKSLRSKPDIVKDENNCPRLQMEGDDPLLEQL